LLSLLKKSTRHGPRAGIMLDDRSIAVAIVQRRAGHRPAIEHCEMHHCEGSEGIEQALRRAVSKLGLANTAAFAVAGPEDYQLVQVEAPEVQPAEIRAAIRWRLRDVIDFHIDDAVVDVFQIPDQSRRAGAKMLFAVAARSAAVQRLVNTVAPVARGFDVIDIPELCLRNISALLPQDQKGVATLLMGSRFAHLILTRQGVLYLARRIEYARGYEVERGVEPEVDAAALALELQRSLDYFESHYDQTAITDLVLAPGDARCRELARRMQGETGLRIGVLDLKEIFDGTESLKAEVTASGLLALGAAMRTSGTTL